MVIPRDYWFAIAIGSILILTLITVLIVASRKTNDEKMMDVVSGAVKTENIPPRKRLQNFLEKGSLFQQYEDYLKLMLERTYDKERTVDSILSWQFEWMLMGLGILLIIHIIFQSPLFDIGVIGICVLMAMKPIFSMNSKWNVRQKEFDENLPQFINHMCLCFDSGAEIETAIRLAVQSLDSDIRNDFDAFLADFSAHPGTPELAFDNLAKRMPTPECRRFCNVTATALRNGNEIKNILKQESEYMVQNYKTQMEVEAKKRQNSADAISTLFIFIPILVIMVAPIISGSL